MIDWTGPDLDRFLAEDSGEPVVMLNLLRFQPDGGRERYADYAHRLRDLSPTFGQDVVYYGNAGAALIPSGEDWDAVVLVRYPSRQAFGEMVKDPAYKAIAHLRTEALLDSVLQPTVSTAIEQ